MDGRKPLSVPAPIAVFIDHRVKYSRKVGLPGEFGVVGFDAP
jgi:hypothetical protein